MDMAVPLHTVVSKNRVNFFQLGCAGPVGGRLLGMLNSASPCIQAQSFLA